MKVLVTGARGQVGSDLMSLLQSRTDITSIGLDLPDWSITDPENVRQTLSDFRPDWVVNLAAYTAVDKAELDPETASSVNGQACESLASTCAEIGAKLLHFSTDYIFPGDTETAYLEDDAFGPINVYGKTKLDGEQAVRERLDRHVVLRVSWVFGRHGNNFVKTMLRLANEKESLSVVADQWGCPTPAIDIAKTILALVARDWSAEEWGTYHYCGYPVTNWHGFAQAVVQRSAKMQGRPPIPVVPISTAEYPTPAKRPKNSAMSCQKIQNLGIDQPCWLDSLDRVLEELS